MPIDVEVLRDAFRRWMPVTAPTQELPVEKPLVQATGGEKVSAALSLDDPEVCPYCKARMRASRAVGIRVVWCEHDRHVGPASNGDTE